MRTTDLLDLIYAIVIEIGTLGLEEPYQAFAKLNGELAEPLVMTRRDLEEWGTTAQAEAAAAAQRRLLGIDEDGNPLV